MPVSKNVVYRLIPVIFRKNNPITAKSAPPVRLKILLGRTLRSLESFLFSKILYQTENLRIGNFARSVETFLRTGTLCYILRSLKCICNNQLRQATKILGINVAAQRYKNFGPGKYRLSRKKFDLKIKIGRYHKIFDIFVKNYSIEEL